MGIKGLSDLLSQYIENKIIELKDIQKSTICIDISIYLYKYKYACSKNDNNIKSHIHCITMLLYKFKKNNINIIFVFDGKASNLKKSVCDKRKETSTIFITQEEKQECIDYCKMIGASYIIADEEADSQCAYLNKNGFCDYIITSDLDILTFGGKKIIKDIGNNKYLLYDSDEILNKLNITYEQFILLCISLGCDYFKGIKGIGKKKVIDYVKNFNISKVDNIEEILLIKSYFINSPHKTIENLINIKESTDEIIITKLLNDCKYDIEFINYFIKLI